jgi:hypothetical protein
VNRGAEHGAGALRRVLSITSLACAALLIGSCSIPSQRQVTPVQPVSGGYPLQPSESGRPTSTPSPLPGTVAALAAARSFGVPAGTALTVHVGNLVITRPGTVIDGMDVHGTIRVMADNVTIERSIVRGGAAATRTDALIAAWWGAKNLVVVDTTLRAQNRSLHIDGIAGANFTARGLDVSHVVDTVKVIGPNVTVLDSYLHDHYYSADDPNQPDGHTHDDGVQIEGGTNILVRGNLIVGAHNAAVMITQNFSQTGNVRIDGNWMENGACAINVTQLGRGSPIVGLSITDNDFGSGAYGMTCPMRLPRTSSFAVAGNRWLADGAIPVVPNWY